MVAVKVIRVWTTFASSWVGGWGRVSWQRLLQAFDPHRQHSFVAVIGMWGSELSRSHLQ
jgi:hypothetical protein